MKKLLLKVFLAFLVMTMTIQVCQMNVYEIHARDNIKIRLNKTSIKLNPKQSVTLKVLKTKSKVKWTSSNKKIATVTSKGKVTAKKVGTTYINAKVNKKTLKCKVIVYKKTQPKKKVKKIVLNRNKITLKWGETFRLKVGIFPAHVISSKIKFISSNPSVASIDSHGMIKTKNIGNTIITAIAYNGVKAKCRVRVINPYYEP